VERMLRESATGSGGRQPGRRSRSQASAFRSVHFYLICWRMISKHLALVRHLSRLPEVGRALRPFVRTLEGYEAMRNHYEHFDERLPGQAGARRLAAPGDLGSLMGETFTFGGEKIDVGPNSLRLMERIVREVLNAFKVAVIQDVAAKTPERLGGLFMPVTTQRIAREVRRILRGLQLPSPR